MSVPIYYLKYERKASKHIDVYRSKQYVMLQTRETVFNLGRQGRINYSFFLQIFLSTVHNSPERSWDAAVTVRDPVPTLLVMLIVQRDMKSPWC